MKWKEYVNAFGLGHRIGVDLPSEDGGNIPDTTVYDKEYHHSWNSCTMVTMGIGQDQMTVTPLQIANAMCIVANKGYFYTPHFVKNIEGGADDEELLGRFRQRHEVLTHIPDKVYDIVHSGMQDVVEIGTGRPARIPGIDMCAKTGTAENKRVIDGRVIRLRSHSLFVCFAPREDPKIVLAVIIENGGYGGAQAAPIASLLVEKYLNDTLRTERLPEVDRIAGVNLMPRYLVRLQFKADSIRAARWARQSGDSSRWIKYQTPSYRAMMLDTSGNVHNPLMDALLKSPVIRYPSLVRKSRIQPPPYAPVNSPGPAPDSSKPLLAPKADSGKRMDSGRRQSPKKPDSTR
jgi:penicillin-binding protein 2